MAVHFTPYLIVILIASIPAGFAAALASRRLAQSTQPPAPLMMAVWAMVGIWAAFVMPTMPLLTVSCALAWMLLVLSTVDALAFRLPDILTLPLLAAGLAVARWLPDHDLVGHAIAAVLGAAVFYAISVAYSRTRGHEGLGMGDAKLAGAAGAWLGWQALPYVVLVACTVGLVWVGIATMRRGKAALSERIPFGVALCFAMWVIWLHGTPGFLGAP